MEREARRRSTEPELGRVLARVFVALGEDLLDISACLGVRDVVEGQARAAPAVDVVETGVVGGERGCLVAVVAVKEMPQQVTPVADVDLRVVQVGEVKRDASAQVL